VASLSGLKVFLTKKQKQLLYKLFQLKALNSMLNKYSQQDKPTLRYGLPLL
jgi:hypothetical protein